MACKNPENLSRLQRRNWRLEAGQRLDFVTSGDRLAQRSAEAAGGLAVLDDQRFWPPELREMLASDSYQVAFVLRDEGKTLDGLRVSPETQAALLPFSWKELIARVYESVREFYAASEKTVGAFADIRVDFAKMEVCRGGEPVRLTTQEFKTLKFLMQNPERVLSRSELLNEVWGYQNYPSTRTVDNHILKLRQKLERDPARPVHFQTVQRAGYKFVP